VQDKKTRGIKIYVDLRKINDACLYDPFLTQFSLVYGKEAVIPMEFIFPSLCIVVIIVLSESGVV
jgi:hypothetical protein